MKRKLFLISIFVLLGLVAYQKYSEYSALKSIDSYESCVASKGSIIQESYPATCVTRLGSRFTQPTPTPTLLHTTTAGEKYNFSFTHPAYFEVKRNPHGSTYPLEESFLLTNLTSSSSITKIEFRALEGWWPKHPSNFAKVKNTTFWYSINPEYVNGAGLVQVMAEKDKEMIYQWDIYGTSDFNDQVIQQILSTFKFTI